MRAIIAVADLLTRSRLEDAGRAAGFDVRATRSVPEPEDAELLLVDLDQPGALEGIERWRAERPDTKVVGFAFHVNEETMARAKALGVAVHPHGATAQGAKLFNGGGSTA